MSSRLNAFGSALESYAYDDNGNRVAVGGQSIVTGLANRLLDDGTYTYTYDNEGNLTKRTLKSDTTKTTEYAYDHRHRLTSVVDKNGATVTQSVAYTYDAQGRRIKRVHDANGAAAGGVTNEFFVYDGNQLSMTFGHTGQLEHRYLHGPADQVLVDEVFATVGSQQVSDEVLWLLGDHQGTVRDVVDDTGTLRKHIDYSSFGRVIDEQFYAENGSSISSSHAEAVEQLFGYTGQERDQTTGLYQMGQRWYDPRTGRWLSEDPSGLGPDANPYRYVHNNPLNYVDPTGLIQAGNPLNNLNIQNGGYSGGKVAAAKPVSTYVASGGLSAGTLGSVLGNSVLSATPNLLSPGAKTAFNAVSGLATVVSVGGFGSDVLSSAAGYTRGLKDSIDRTARSVYEGVTYAWNDPGGAATSVARGIESTLVTGLDYTAGWLLEPTRNRNLASIDSKYQAAQQQLDRLKNATVYEQARTIGNVVGTAGQAFVPGTNVARTTRTTSTFLPLAIIDDVAPSSTPAWRQYEQRFGGQETPLTTTFQGKTVTVRLDKPPSGSTIVDFKDYNWNKSSYNKPFIQEKVAESFTTQIQKYQTIRPNIHFQFSQEPPPWAAQSIQSAGGTYSVVP